MDLRAYTRQRTTPDVYESPTAGRTCHNGDCSLQIHSSSLTLSTDKRQRSCGSLIPIDSSIQTPASRKLPSLQVGRVGDGRGGEKDQGG